MTYAVRIRDTVTGIEREHVADGEWDAGAEYLWTEGNYSCDCNRALFFDHAGNEDPGTFMPCGDTRYTVTLPGDPTPQPPASRPPR